MSRPEAQNGGDFWSRRRAAVAAEEHADSRAEQQAQEAEARAALDDKSDEEILSELGLKDPETLEQGDDFSAFLKSEVPDRLRRRALRRLWRSNPVLANLDSLVDYGEDYTDAATVVENMQTAYRVGKGMLAHIEKQLEAEAAKNAPTPEESPDEAAPEDADLAQGEPAADEGVAPVVSASEPEVVIAAAQQDGDPVSQEKQSERGALTQEVALPSPRRMRFDYGARKESQ